MMRNMLEYKGYHTRIEFDANTMSLRGKIEGINDFIDFETEDISDIEEEFHKAVDDYLEFCVEVGKEPEKEYKGTFNVRISPELHRKISLCAFRDGQSLNSEVEKAISLYVDSNYSQTLALAESVRNLTETIRMDGSGYGNEKMVNSNSIIPFPAMKHIYREEVKEL